MLKRLTPEQAGRLTHLDLEDPFTSRRAIGFTLTPIDEKWDRVDYYGESIFDPSRALRRPEWVYILVNKDIPGVCKIGMTTTSVEQRCKEINAATGVISPWYPVYRYKCVNSYYLEQDIHRYLEQRGYRVSPNREGFYIDSSTARDVIELLGKKYLPNAPLEDPGDSTGQ